MKKTLERQAALKVIEENQIEKKKRQKQAEAEKKKDAKLIE